MNEEKYFYTGKDCMHNSIKDLKKIQDKIFPASFKYHYENNTQYRQYCDLLKISPLDVKTSDDIFKIPLIPSSVFKQCEVISGDKKNIKKVCTSSGTKGSISRVLRNEATIEHFIESIEVSLKYIIGVKQNSYFIILGPEPDETEDLWIAYAMSQIVRLYPVEHCVKGGKLVSEKVIKIINEKKEKYDQIVIIGAPIMLLNFNQYLTDKNIKYAEKNKFTFITAGGWKRFKSSQLLPEIFRKNLIENFNGCKEEDFFDVYNSVELNSCITECYCHHKHTMPWTRVVALDPVTGKCLADGEIGILAIYDASSISYPCFILSDDYGKVVFNGKCSCGRTGQGIDFIRRIETVESRGCALKMDKQYTK